MREVRDLLQTAHNFHGCPLCPETGCCPFGTSSCYSSRPAEAERCTLAVSFCSCAGAITSVGDDRAAVACGPVGNVLSLSLAAERHGDFQVEERMCGEHGSPLGNLPIWSSSERRYLNPFADDGAMTVISMLSGGSRLDFARRVLGGMDLFAGRPLPMGPRVNERGGAYEARNLSIAYLLKSYGRFYGPVDDTVDVYNRQCSKLATARDLSVMAATLANGGTNPVSGMKVVSSEAAEYSVNTLARRGLTEDSHRWRRETGGVPAIYGSKGVLVVVFRGIGGLAVASPTACRTECSADCETRSIDTCIHIAKRMGSYV